MQAGNPGVQGDLGPAEVQPDLFRAADVQDVLDHPSHGLGRVPEPPEVGFGGGAPVLLPVHELQAHLDGGKGILQVMHDEMEELFPLLLEVEQAVPFLLDLGLEPLETHEAPDADDELPLQDRFAQEIIPLGPEGQGMHVRALVGGQEDDRQEITVRQLADAAADLEAVHARHLDVQQHQFRLVGGEQREGLLSALSRFHLVVAAFQHGADAPTRQGVIVHHEDPGPVIRPARGKSTHPPCLTSDVSFKSPENCWD